MKAAVARETVAGERRVALVPDLVARLGEADLTVHVQPGAGAPAGFTDEDYLQAGAQVAEDAADAADVLLAVRAPEPELIGRLADDGTVIAYGGDVDTGGRTFLAMDRIPRISRAQSMDALSSQALISGYQVALIAAERLPRFFPLAMTAAGTVPPARVLILGAGVAGLQAVATTRRLGARVAAYDVRAAAAEEVRSLGADFVELDLPALEGTGGYAREMSEERSRLQLELLAPHVAAADVLITTAAVPGRPAPRLVTAEMVAAMPAGAVVVDLAAEQGGNVEGAVPGEEVRIKDVVVIGAKDIPSRLPGQASRLYAANVVNLLVHAAGCGFDPDDEILAACRRPDDGEA
ncbi:MAG: NAD(P)(+) transhydrogenase (Re/Si-specific) subunit alpha [Streptosporangiales bacterium]|nr:NAD(P)(+) transhydrogenase (Re/Si-specific) subunit alpha [Streptosporangiales bacterium]